MFASQNTVPTLNEIGDVIAPTPAANDFLQRNAGNTDWINVTPAVLAAALSHTNLQDIGANSHVAIDSHIADATIHFADAPADANDYVRNNNAWVIATGGGVTDHFLLTNIGANTHVQIDSHIADATIHFADAPADASSYVRNNNAWVAESGGVSDHTLLSNIGVNTHPQIDTHIADGTIHFTVASIDHGSISGLADDDHLQYLLIDGTRAMTGGLDFATGGDAVINNQFLDGDIHFDVNNTSGGANKRAMTITAEDAVQGSSSVDLRPSDTVYLSNFIFMQTSLQIVNTESGFASQVTLRLDNAVPATTIRTFGVFTTDPGFGSWTVSLGTGVGPNTMSFTGAFDTLFSIASGQVFEFNGPLVLTNTLSPATENILLADTFTTGGGFIGGGILSNGTVTYDNGFFIWGLMIEQKTYRAAAAPGFAAFTLFNALPLIENDGNFALVSAILLNCGINHRRRTSGTSTVGQTFGLSFSPQASTTVSGAVMTRTNGVIGMAISPTFGTVAGSTVNLGTIRGITFANPIPGLFQPSAGTENMTAYLGIDFANITFGGVNRVVEVVRSVLNSGTNIRFLNHTGTAESQFGGHVHLNNGVFLKFGGTNALFNAGILWDVATTSLSFTGGRVRVAGTITYPPIVPGALAAGNNNNWTGLGTDAFSLSMRHWARISGNATTSVITGIDTTDVEDGDSFELTNVSANTINIGHQDAASTAANRIISPTGATYQLAADQTVVIRYDSTTARWRLLGGTGA